MIKLTTPDIHHHLEMRMRQRGITLNEIAETVNTGWAVEDAKEGTLGKTLIFQYNALWEGKLYEQKEVTVYYKYKDERIILLTAMARYGSGFRKNKGE